MLTLTLGQLSIVLPSPDFGDKESVNYRKVINKSRGNELIISPKMGYQYLNAITTYSYSVSFINELLKQQLLTFLASTVGQVINIVDYNDATYNGIILTTSAEITQPGRNNNQVNLDIMKIDDRLGSIIIIQGMHSNKLITQGYGLS